MQVEIHREFPGKVMRDRDTDKVLVARAKPIAARLQAITPRRTGATAGSTRIETGHTNAKRDRRAVRIVQDFGAVPLNFRTRRRYMLQAL